MRKMKNCIGLLAILFVGALLLSSCLKEYVEPGEMEIESRMVTDFNSINISNAFEVYVSKSDTEELTLEAYSGYLPHITTEVRANTLFIFMDDKYEYNAKKKQKVYLKLKSLQSIKASGATKIIGSTDFVSENFNVNLSGASYLNMSLIVSNKLTCNASGASIVNLAGSSTELVVADLSGASKFSAFNLIAEKATLSISGASDVELYVTKELNFTASGASSIKYKGNPEIVKQSTSGASSVVKL
jgi:hypothetical protein